MLLTPTTKYYDKLDLVFNTVIVTILYANKGVRSAWTEYTTQHKKVLRVANKWFVSKKIERTLEETQADIPVPSIPRLFDATDTSKTNY